MDHSASNFSAPELERLRRLASDFAGQFMVISRREPGRQMTVRLRGSRLPEVKWLAAELRERLGDLGDGRFAVEISDELAGAKAGTYRIDVDYFLNH